LKQLIEEMRNQSKVIEEEGLKPHSYPIFQLLQKERTDQKEEKERLKENTQIIVEHIEGLVVIDWVNKEDVKREMRKKSSASSGQANVRPIKLSRLLSKSLNWRKSITKNKAPFMGAFFYIVSVGPFTRSHSLRSS
jgi:type I restriction enzyme, R subunit